jgi:teichuronic acid biosynthesis glycosyltransferase TuaG
MKVSALTLIHNRADLFSETIASVLNQSYPVHELIIIDDGSTEDVKAVAEGFKDERVKYFYCKRVGVISKLRNMAISKASGDVMAFIDSDDLWHEDKIKLHISEMLENNTILSFSDCRLFDQNGFYDSTVCESMNKVDPDIFKELTEHNQTLAFGTNIFFRKLEGITVFDEKLFVGEHDFITLLSAKYKATYIDHVLNYIRRHDRNTSRENSVVEILAPLEYNRTLNKLLAENLISGKMYKKIKADNCTKAGFAYINRRCFKTGLKFITSAFLLRPNINYLKILAKSFWLRVIS